MSRRSLLRILAGVAATPYASRRARAGPEVAASVAVSYDQPGRIIPENFIGLSYESAVLASPDYLSPRNPALHGLLRALGPGAVLRLGGNTSESTTWRGTSNASETFVITPAAIDALAELVKALNWQLIYGLNLARGNPEAAAEEAAYVARAVGSRLLAFQIGNEPDGFGRWSAVRPQTYDFQAFLAEWRQFYTAIRARLPTAPFAGPDIVAEQKWIRPFVAAAGDALVLGDAALLRRRSCRRATYQLGATVELCASSQSHACGDALDQRELAPSLSHCRDKFDFQRGATRRE